MSLGLCILMILFVALLCINVPIAFIFFYILKYFVTKFNYLLNKTIPLGIEVYL